MKKIVFVSFCCASTLLTFAQTGLQKSTPYFTLFPVFGKDVSVVKISERVLLETMKISLHQSVDEIYEKESLQRELSKMELLPVECNMPTARLSELGMQASIDRLNESLRITKIQVIHGMKKYVHDAIDHLILDERYYQYSQKQITLVNYFSQQVAPKLAEETKLLVQSYMDLNKVNTNWHELFDVYNKFSRAKVNVDPATHLGAESLTCFFQTLQRFDESSFN